VSPLGNRHSTRSRPDSTLRVSRDHQDKESRPFFPLFTGQQKLTAEQGYGQAIAVAGGKRQAPGETTRSALRMALADGSYDVTVVDADTGLANLLFRTGLGSATSRSDLLLGDDGVAATDAAAS